MHLTFSTESHGNVIFPPTNWKENGGNQKVNSSDFLIVLHKQTAPLQPHYRSNNNKDKPELHLSEQSVKEHKSVTSFDI